MGICYDYDKTLRAYSAEIDDIVEQSLEYLRGIMMILLKDRRHGALLMAIHIHECSKLHYQKNSYNRKRLLEREKDIDHFYYKLIEKSLRKELKQVKELLKNVKMAYKKIPNRISSSYIEDVRDFIENIEEEFSYQLIRHKRDYLAIKNEHGYVDISLLEVNPDLAFTEEEKCIIRNLYGDTIYMFQQTENVIQYPNVPERRREHDRRRRPRG